MKELSITSKRKVIKLFLTGLSYDEIAHQVGIAKGSVVNIINSFREGCLAVPPDMTEYADALRQVAVDLRKSNTSIAQVRSCLKLDAKLREMGVTSEQAEQWLEICHSIASPSVSSEQFVAAALELARVSSEDGLSYKDVLDDYNAKLKRSRELSREIAVEQGRLAETRAARQEEKKQATRELNAVTKAVDTAQAVLRRQEEDLKARMNEHLAQHKLSWKKINTAVALLDTELGRAGMAKVDIKQLAERIFDAGSLVRLIRQLEKERDDLQSVVNHLAQKKNTIAASISELEDIDGGLRTSIPADRQKLDKLNAELNSKRLELEDLQRTASEFTQNLYVSHLIVDFLFVPKAISDYDLDRLVSLMLGLRQQRLGIGPKQVRDRDGNVVCECQVPRMHGTIRMDQSDIDAVRETFAYVLAPLVKDKFISKSDYQTIKIKHAIEVADAILQEQKRHIF